MFCHIRFNYFIMNEIIEIIKQPWPWYVSGPLIALVMFILLFFGNSFGVSANFRTICSMTGGGKNCDFFEADLQRSVFDGATLLWDDPAPDDMFETVGENQFGRNLEALRELRRTSTRVSCGRDNVPSDRRSGCQDRREGSVPVGVGGHNV